MSLHIAASASNGAPASPALPERDPGARADRVLRRSLSGIAMALSACFAALVDSFVGGLSDSLFDDET